MNPLLTILALMVVGQVGEMGGVPATAPSHFTTLSQISCPAGQSPSGPGDGGSPVCMAGGGYWFDAGNGGIATAALPVEAAELTGTEGSGGVDVQDRSGIWPTASTNWAESFFLNQVANLQPDGGGNDDTSYFIMAPIDETGPDGVLGVPGSFNFVYTLGGDGGIAAGFYDSNLNLRAYERELGQMGGAPATKSTDFPTLSQVSCPAGQYLAGPGDGGAPICGGGNSAGAIPAVPSTYVVFGGADGGLVGSPDLEYSGGELDIGAPGTTVVAGLVCQAPGLADPMATFLFFADGGVADQINPDGTVTIVDAASSHEAVALDQITCPANQARVGPGDGGVPICTPINGYTDTFGGAFDLGAYVLASDTIGAWTAPVGGSVTDINIAVPFSGTSTETDGGYLTIGVWDLTTGEDYFDTSVSCTGQSSIEASCTSVDGGCYFSKADSLAALVDATTCATYPGGSVNVQLTMPGGPGGAGLWNLPSNIYPDGGLSILTVVNGATFNGAVSLEPATTALAGSEPPTLAQVNCGLITQPDGGGLASGDVPSGSPDGGFVCVPVSSSGGGGSNWDGGTGWPNLTGGLDSNVVLFVPLSDVNPDGGNPANYVDLGTAGGTCAPNTGSFPSRTGYIGGWPSLYGSGSQTNWVQCLGSLVPSVGTTAATISILEYTPTTASSVYWGKAYSSLWSAPYYSFGIQSSGGGGYQHPVCYLTVFGTSVSLNVTNSADYNVAGSTALYSCVYDGINLYVEVDGNVVGTTKVSQDGGPQPIDWNDGGGVWMVGGSIAGNDNIYGALSAARADSVARPQSYMQALWNQYAGY